MVQRSEVSKEPWQVGGGFDAIESVAKSMNEMVASKTQQGCGTCSLVLAQRALSQRRPYQDRRLLL